VRVHLDTDLGGDPDDACALALLLGLPSVELTGVTTTIDPGGRRAGLVREVLRLAGRDDVPVVAGAEHSSSHDRPASPETGPRYWPGPVDPLPADPGAAVDAIRRSVAGGATLVAIGPLTNLAMLEAARPGSLRTSRTVAMGGWLGTAPPGPGMPPWGPARDFNVQWDVRAAEAVLAACDDVTLVPVTTTVGVPLRRADLPRLAAAGRLGALLARQSQAYADDRGYPQLARQYAGLPDDLVNFHHDPLTCAVATDWSGATVTDARVRVVVEDAVLRLEPAGAADAAARTVRLAVGADAAAFTELWLAAVERAAAGGDPAT